ncbi:MAG: SMI1/KNR4 family protein [Planctomycetota bacterium]
MSEVFESVDWDDPIPAPSQEEIAAVERVLGVQLPSDFIEFCRHYHGGFPDPDEIEVEGFGTTMVNSIIPFVDVPDERIRSIVSVVEAVEGLHHKLVPFAVEPGGNYFCFDYRSANQKVVFWFHEQSTIFDVCDSFTEFVEILANA